MYELSPSLVDEIRPCLRLEFKILLYYCDKLAALSCMKVSETWSDIHVTCQSQAKDLVGEK